MGPAFTLLVTINNSFHDIATAMLTASGVMMWVILRRAETLQDAGARSFLISIYRAFSKVVTFTLVWIMAGAIPRMITFTNREWADANAGGYMAGLIAKHAVILVTVLGGAYLWITLTRRMREIEERDNG